MFRIVSPVIKQNNDSESLIQQFIRTSIRYGELMEKHDFTSAGKEINALYKIIKYIKKNEHNDLKILLPLLKHSNDYVRLLTASNTYYISGNEARVTLLELRDKKDTFVSLDARMALDILSKEENKPSFLKRVMKFFK